MDKLLVLALKGDWPLLRWLFDVDQSNSSLISPPQYDDTLRIDSINKELFKSFVLQYIVSSAEEFLSEQIVDLTASNPNATKADGKKKTDKKALELNDANFPALGRPVVISTVATLAPLEHGRRHTRRIAPTAIPPSEQLTLSSKFLKPLGEEVDGLEALTSVPGKKNFFL
jgi:hypothetical protein